MIVPLVIVFLATLAAAVVAYGTQPGWAEYQHGLQLILWSRRLQWPLVSVSLILCVGLIALVISGRRRAWWLVGLGPVLVLFVQWLQTGYARVFPVVDGPSFVDAGRAGGLRDNDGVVAVTFGDTDYAYPCATLSRAPVVIQADHERRMILLWSAQANRVLAFRASHDLKARDLEVVSMPPAGPVLYNNRLGQFINAMKGLGVDGQKAAGFGSPIPTSKTTWGRWREANPSGKVMADAGPTAAGNLAGILPPVAAGGLMAVERGGGDARRSAVVVVGTTRPAAVAAESLSATPIELQADGVTAVVFRAGSGQPARAFVVPVTKEGAAKIVARRDPKSAAVLLRDETTGAAWNTAGTPVGGSKEPHGKRLVPLSVDEGVDEDAFSRAWPGEMVYREEAKPPPAEVRPALAPAGNGVTSRTAKARAASHARSTR